MDVVLFKKAGTKIELTRDRKPQEVKTELYIIAKRGEDLKNILNRLGSNIIALHSEAGIPISGAFDTSSYDVIFDPLNFPDEIKNILKEKVVKDHINGDGFFPVLFIRGS